MILVDQQEGSRQLTASLERAGLPIERTFLDSADLYFVGRGEGGKPVSIGAEYKTLSELITSLHSARLQGHQLLKMRAANPDEAPLYDFCYLIVEGEILYDSTGVLMRRTGRRAAKPLPGRMNVVELYKRVHVLHLRGGLNTIWTPTRRDTVRQIEALYRVWTDKDLDEHKSHLGIYVPPTLARPSCFLSTVRMWPSVGLKAAQAAKVRFRSIRRAANAGPRAWAALETVDKKGKTRKFGSRAAEKVEAALVKED